MVNPKANDSPKKYDTLRSLLSQIINFPTIVAVGIYSIIRNHHRIPKGIYNIKVQVQVQVKGAISFFNPVPQPLSANPRNVLLCCRRFVDKQAIYGPVCVTNSHDQHFFRSMRRVYKSLRGRIAGFSLREIGMFRFIKFEPTHTIHVNCSENDQLPPQDHVEYEIDYPPGYNPGSLPFAPPVRPDLMLFFYQNPGCAPSNEEYVKYIPKRIVGNPDPPSEAWGLHIEEGLSVWKFWLMFLSVFIASIVFIVVWLILHPGDLQNAVAPPGLIFVIISTLFVAPEFVGYHSKVKMV